MGMRDIATVNWCVWHLKHATYINNLVSQTSVLRSHIML